MPPAITQLWKNTFVKGGVIITITAFLTNILNYFFQSVLAHTLGRSSFGEIATLFSYMTVFSVPLSVIATIIIQKVSSSKNRIEYAQQLEEYFFRKLRTWGFLLLIPLFLIPYMPQITNLSPITAYALIPFILMSVLSMYHVSALQGLTLFLEFSLIGILAAMIKLAGPILVYFKIDGQLTVILCIFLSTLFTFVANFVVFRRSVGHAKLHKSIKRIESRIARFFTSKQFIITLLSLSAIVALNNIDIIFVRKLFNADETGLYASWSLFAKIIFFIISPVASVSFVFFSGSGRAENKKAMGYFFLSMISITIIAFLGYHYLGYIFIPYFFGNQFLAVIPYLGLASLFGSFYTIIFFINNYFLAKVSKMALILPLSIPIYIGAIFFSHRTIQAVFVTDVLFAVGLALTYTIGYVIHIRHEA